MCRDVHGVDISAEMIQRGQQRPSDLPNVHFHQGNGYDLAPFQSSIFDVVYCAFVFQHMPKTSVFNYLQEVNRVLKPEGVVRFQVPNLLQHEGFESFKHFAEPYFVRHPYPMNFYTPAEVIQLTAKAGFWVEELTDDIMVRARKCKHAGIALDITGGDDLVDLKARNRQLQQANNQLVKRLDGILGNPMVRTAIAIRDRLRGRSGFAPRVS
jgi:SAM-dependent methyltransferase